MPSADGVGAGVGVGEGGAVGSGDGVGIAPSFPSTPSAAVRLASTARAGSPDDSPCSF
ncbi:MAG: hypothetical protein IH797_08195 [Chloroflexi bacterium]|nr:hypothetical protein [Chloroflexota bacterium]